MVWLASFDFDILYPSLVPDPKNTVADAQSREPFVRPTLMHHLTPSTP